MGRNFWTKTSVYITEVFVSLICVLNFLSVQPIYIYRMERGCERIYLLLMLTTPTYKTSILDIIMILHNFFMILGIM